MENLNTALVSPSSSKLVINCTNFKNHTSGFTGPRRRSTFALPFKLSTSRIALRTSLISASASASPCQNVKMTMDTLEKLMEDPQMQKMIYPYLPEEMRNPTSFKGMLQNPEYRKRLQKMLDIMGERGEWGSRLLDSLKNFDPNSPRVKQQFEQFGLASEEIVTKVMADPEIARGFQIPRLQAAIMEISRNHMNIIKYQNDKEVKTIMTKIAKLFHGLTGIS